MPLAWRRTLERLAFIWVALLVAGGLVRSAVTRSVGNLFPILLLVVGVATAVALGRRSDRRVQTAANSSAYFRGFCTIRVREVARSPLFASQVASVTHTGRLVGWGAMSGTLLVGNRGLAWEPGRWARRTGASEMTIPWASVERTNVDRMPLSAILTVHLADGTYIQMRTMRASDLRHAIARATGTV
jgi:hypothetical protein